MSQTNRILFELVAERERQETKFPNQHLPSGTTFRYWQAKENEAKEAVDRQVANGTLTWLSVLNEEVCEAFAEMDEDKLRAELIQVAAVAVRWIEDIDQHAVDLGASDE